MPLTETYRPTTRDQPIGQDKIRAKIDLLRPRGLSGRGYWINGQSGPAKPPS